MTTLHMDGWTAYEAPTLETTEKWPMESVAPKPPDVPKTLSSKNHTAKHYLEALGWILLCTFFGLAGGPVGVVIGFAFGIYAAIERWNEESPPKVYTDKNPGDWSFDQIAPHTINYIDHQRHLQKISSGGFRAEAVFVRQDGAACYRDYEGKTYYIGSDGQWHQYV